MRVSCQSTYHLGRPHPNRNDIATSRARAALRSVDTLLHWNHVPPISALGLRLNRLCLRLGRAGLLAVGFCLLGCAHFGKASRMRKRVSFRVVAARTTNFGIGAPMPLPPGSSERRQGTVANYDRKKNTNHSEPQCVLILSILFIPSKNEPPTRFGGIDCAKQSLGREDEM